MWYKAQCIRECIFGGVRRRVGDIYEGPMKPPRHFAISEENDFEEETVEVDKVCPHCGNKVGVEKKPAPKKSKKEEPAIVTDVGEDNLPCVVPLKAPIGQVRIMSKENLAMYALSHGLNIDPNVMTKGQMVDEIIQIIYGGSEE